MIKVYRSYFGVQSLAWIGPASRFDLFFTRKAYGFVRKHKEPDGYGWSGPYIIEE